jgi:hypothetical protein
MILRALLRKAISRSRFMISSRSKPVSGKTCGSGQKRTVVPVSLALPTVWTGVWGTPRR